MTESDVIREMIADLDHPLTRAHCENAVCPGCDGEGQNSTHLGSFTSSEWHELDEDWQDMYLSGGLDQVCPECGGNRVVLVLKPTAPNEAHRDLAEWLSTEAMYAAERAAGA